MHIYLVDGEMLLCMPMEIIINGPNLKIKTTGLLPTFTQYQLNTHFYKHNSIRL